MKPLRAAALLLLLAPAAAAQQEPAAVAGPESDPVLAELRDKLASDPAVDEIVAERVARSKLAGLLTPEPAPAARLAAVREWIAKDPDSAARVALGLERDDEKGATSYEDALIKQLGTTYEANPGAANGLFARLRRSAKDAKLVKKQAQEDVSEDEKRELLRALFEGNGAKTDKKLDMPEDGGAGARPPAASFDGYYDRLSAGNLRGYSPQLLALQSALNARRPPGAPALVETGKLDFATLSFPAYGMKYDVENLEARLSRDRILALARLAGTAPTASDWKDPELEARLSAKVPDAKLSPRLRHAAELALKARTALGIFSSAAKKSRDPNAVTRPLLVELGQKQKDTARWIAAAALEEELSRLEELESFPTPELIARIDAAPAAQSERDAYARRGADLRAIVARVKANAEKARGLLESDSWAGSLAAVDGLVAENQKLKRDLGRDIDDFSRVPYLIADARVSQPRWREILDDVAVKWAPGLSYSRGVAQRRGRLARLLGVFEQIAGGDADAAHQALLNAGAVPP